MIENPSPTLASIPHVLPDLGQQQSPARAVVRANQNTALKYVDVTLMTNDYAQSPSQMAGKAVMNMFACFPRLPLIVSSEEEERGSSSPRFPIRVLERHPYTTQTFIPMGLAASDPSTRYLVIVAPTLARTEDCPGPGPPDLENTRAFWAHGGQAVTYGPGTWHAPMAVVGASRVDFVVVQFCNGVPEEDCQEVGVEEGLEVMVDSLETAEDSEPKGNNKSYLQCFRAGLKNVTVDVSARFLNRPWAHHVSSWFDAFQLSLCCVSIRGGAYGPRVLSMSQFKSPSLLDPWVQCWSRCLLYFLKIELGARKCITQRYDMEQHSLPNLVA